MSCALGWACWKTYVGRPETDVPRQAAMRALGIGLSYAGHGEDALTVKEAELSMRRRLGASEESILVTQGNLAYAYQVHGRNDEALRMRRDVYSGRSKLLGDEHLETIKAAYNYAGHLAELRRFREAKILFRKVIPVARRVLGEHNITVFRMRWVYAQTLYMDDDATPTDRREGITTLEETERTARRVLGGSHPLTSAIEGDLKNVRAHARETPSPPPGSA